MKKTAFIIGGSSGIGLETVKGLLQRGYTVVNGSRSGCPIEEVESLIFDVTDKNEIERSISDTISRFGKIDVFIYSAGFSMASPVEYAAEIDYRYLFEVNFFGFVECVKSLVPHMKNVGGGRIVYVSSIGGIIPLPFDAFYSASKAAADMFIRALNVELKPYHIYSTAVQPGGTSTRFTFKRKVYDDGQVGDYAARMNTAVSKLAEKEQGGMRPEKVSATILKTLDKKRPPQTVASGFKNKAVAMSARLLPKKVVAALSEKSFGL